MYKLITSGRNTGDLSFSFDRDRERRKRELTKTKNIKGKYHETIMLKDVFGFTEHQAKSTYGLRYKLTLTRNGDNAVLKKSNAGILKFKLIVMIGMFLIIHYRLPRKKYQWTRL